MQLSHRFTVPARVEDVWTAFNRIDRVAPCFPGATLDRFTGDEFSGSIKIKFGPILLLYSGSGRIVERNATERRMFIEAKGRDRRGQGGATVALGAEFVAVDGGTEIRAETDLTLTGRPAQFGQALITEVVDRVLERFVRCVAEQLAVRGPAAVGAEPGREPVPVDGVEPAPAEPSRFQDPAALTAEAGPAGAGSATGPEDADTEVAAAPIAAGSADADQRAPDPADAGPGAVPVAERKGAEPAAAEAAAAPEPERDSDFATAPTESDRRTDFLTPGPRAAVPAVRPAATPAEREPTREALRRYAPAAAAAAAGVTAVVAWALSRRKR